MSEQNDTTTTTTETTTNGANGDFHAKTGRTWPGPIPERGIYAACLASYNSGILHGCWIDCEGKDANDIQSEIAEMLEASPDPCAEEWAIHDYAGIPSSFGEYPDLEKIVEWVEMIEEHGEAWAAYVDAFGEHYATPDGFTDAYCGCYRSPEEYAEELFNDCHNIPDYLHNYIDWQAVARDLRIGGDNYFQEGGDGMTYVFRNS